MATLAELARSHTSLDTSQLGHLQRLVGSWGMLSDLCFADLLLFAPVASGAGGAGSRFIVLGQVRPTTSQTLHRDDLVSRIFSEDERPLVGRALRLGEIVEGEIAVTPRGERARTQCIPVRWRGEVIGVMTRESVPNVGRRPGELERFYVETFDRFARMIVRGEFPFGSEEATETEEAPRVGDGVLILDEHGRIEYSSPNAVSALHRMGISSNASGMRLQELGIEANVVDAALATLYPVTEEIERGEQQGQGASILLRCIPLLDNQRATGALLLMRDVTQLRRLSKLLLSKDDTIREVHHRIKNNLQTLSSLVRLQARRLESSEARAALEETERRIRSIARVHEILSREAVEEVPFDEIVEDLVRVAADAAQSLQVSVEFVVEGEIGELPAQVATPLAVVLQEIVQNAVEHAFEPAEDFGIADTTSRVTIELKNDGDRLHIAVRDNGRGLPQGFDIERTDSLGLSLVRSMVASQLEGTIEMVTDGGTNVVLDVPAQGAA